MRKSLEEMCRLVTGYGAWHIGDIQVSDGPHGVRAQEDGAKNNDSYEATCFPTASSVDLPVSLWTVRWHCRSW